MRGISICVTLRNRAHLYKYQLESLSRQDYPGPLELCVLDENSDDNLLSIIDRYSEDFTFRYAQYDGTKSYIPCINPAASLNTLLRYLPTNEYVIKTDPEIVFKDPWVISEIVENLEQDDTRMYNARSHFTEPDGWWNNYEDIIAGYQRHYHYSEGGPFSRSKFYFCSGFSRTKFIELGGIEELMCYGKGYDDTLFREVWKNKYGQYEKEITGEVIHLWHGPPTFRPALETANSRTFEALKIFDEANRLGIKNSELVRLNEARWANPNSLSKIYTIERGAITKVDDINDGESVSVSLPF
jgi:glycosyltransferase involved in cell wall biosynthesis